MVKGTLIPIGGNEDKGDDLTEESSLDFVEQGILSHVVRESGGSDAFIVVIPTASRIPKEVGENYLDAFGKLGCNNVQVLDIRSKSDSEKPKFLEALKKANCVMFSGGDQSKIAKKIGGTTFHKILAERYVNDAGFVIAGTSAGAMNAMNAKSTGAATQ